MSLHPFSHGNGRIAYGPSECSAFTDVLSQVEGPQDAHLIGYGTGAVYWITDPSDPGKLQPIGAPGELLIEGPIVGRGYLSDAEKAEAAFIDLPSWLPTFRGGFYGKLYRTEDLVQYTNGQRIRYLGRKDAQMKLNRQRLELEEVQHAVREAFGCTAEKVMVDIITPADIKSQPILVAFILLQNSSTNSGLSDDADIFAAPSAEFRQLAELAITILRKCLPGYMIPSILVPLAVLSLTASGKTYQRLICARASALSRRELGLFMLPETGKIFPSTEIEQALYKLTKEILVLENFLMEDNFFHLGGDPISAMNLTARARDKGFRLQTEHVFAAPCLADLALSIEVCSTEQAQLEVFSPFTLLPGSMTMESAIQQAQAQCDVLADEFEDTYPCTPAQEGMIAITAMYNKMYTSQAVLQLPVDLDISRFKAAWKETIARNPILRTRIIATEQGLLQVVIRQSIAWGNPTAID
jgi:aryl carrier-like protein